MGSVIVAHGLSCSTACGIFPDQESNLCPHHCQANYLSLSHQEALVVIIMIAVDIIDCLITSPPSHCNYMRAETVCFFCMIRAWTANTELVLDKYTVSEWISQISSKMNVFLGELIEYLSHSDWVKGIWLVPEEAKYKWEEGRSGVQSIWRAGLCTAPGSSVTCSLLEEGNGNPLQYSCLENPRDRGAGGLPSMGSHRVGHNWNNLAAAAAAAAHSWDKRGFQGR